MEDASKWLWKFLAGAKTAGDVYSRALVVYAAQHYASQLVLPTAQRRSSALPRSYKDTARKAFEQITKSVLPASYVQLQRAIAAEARSYHKQADACRGRAARSLTAAAAPGDVEPRRRTQGTPPSTPRSRGTSTSTTTAGRTTRATTSATDAHLTTARRLGTSRSCPEPARLPPQEPRHHDPVPVTTVNGFPGYPIVA